MSTSRGNVVDPWQVIDRHGSDAFRWYLLTAQQPWAVYRFSTETVGDSVRQFLLTLWNTYSFFVLYANAEGLGPDEISGAPVTDLDRWAVSRLQGVTRTVIDRMDDFDCTAAGREIADLRRPAVELVRAAQPAAVLGWRPGRLRHAPALPGRAAKLLAPFVPFVTEEIYGNLTGDGDSVHLQDHPEPDAELEDGELEAGVEAAMRAIELGRAARAQAKVKNRQPLARAVIVATDTERVEVERLADVVAAELNVKELEFVSEQQELVSYEVKPNYRALGPRFGSAMPQVAAAIEALDPGHVAEATRGERRIGINVDGTEHVLAPGRFHARDAPTRRVRGRGRGRPRRRPRTGDRRELRREGLAREIVHAVQAARKGAGLDVSDRINLALGGDETLLEAARAHAGYLAGETLATSVTYDGGGGDGSLAHGPAEVAASSGARGHGMPLPHGREVDRSADSLRAPGKQPSIAEGHCLWSGPPLEGHRSAAVGRQPCKCEVSRDEGTATPSRLDGLSTQGYSAVERGFW